VYACVRGRLRLSRSHRRGTVKKRLLAGVLVAVFGASGVAYAAGAFNQVHPNEYDPAHTMLVNGAWLNGIGCPTGADVATYPATTATGTYTDPACTSGDASDRRNAGLLLAKTGPTSNNAEPYAELKNVKGIEITELGYDLRKTGSATDPRGSTCSVEAPMFQLQSGADVYYIGCMSPPPDSQTAGDGFIRLRWGGSGGLWAYKNGATLTNISGMTFDKAYIVFQDGYGAGSADASNFGLSVLDNIDVNTVLVGHGSTDAN
jgi:hypothetical protein